MDSTKLSLQQIRTLLRTLRRQQTYITHLSGRMDKKHFPRNDPLKAATDETKRAATKLVDVLRGMEQDRESPPY